MELQMRNNIFLGSGGKRAAGSGVRARSLELVVDLRDGDDEACGAGFVGGGRECLL